MDEANYTISTFEIVPVERLGLDPDSMYMENILHALQNTGFDLLQRPDKSELIKQFDIREKEKVYQLCKKVFADSEDEMVWLISEFFGYLFIIPAKHDLLFGLASTEDPEQIGPYGRPPSYILAEVGDYTYRPSIARMLVSGALAQHGFDELSKNLECISSFPRETALAGEIIFVDPPIEFNVVWQIVDKGYELHSMTVLSSRFLTQGVVKLLQDETSLSEVEIAKAFPFQLFSVAIKGEEEYPFTLLNHFSVRARKGAFNEVLNELLGISVHLNWYLTYDGKISKSDVLKYALMQNARLKQIEEKEQRISYSLSILQKRYPARSEIIEWEVNNLYTNIVPFSPIYLSWKAHLQAIVQNEERIGYGFSSIVSQFDWQLLEKNGIASSNDGKQIVELLRVHPASTLTKMRVIIERIVNFLFRREFPRESQRASLANKIQKLNEVSVFPPFIYIYINTLRLTGNIGAHEGTGARQDVEAVLPIFLRVVEWFLDKEAEGVS